MYILNLCRIFFQNSKITNNWTTHTSVQNEDIQLLSVKQLYDDVITTVTYRFLLINNHSMHKLGHYYNLKHGTHSVEVILKFDLNA